MKVAKVIIPDGITLALQSRTKPAVIEELLDLLAAAGQVRDRKTALHAIMEREAKMSTGMQHGLALPHAKTDAVDRLIGAIGICREGLDFQSLDGLPSQIFVLTLSPLSRTGPHIQFLAEIGRTLNSEEARERLLKAQTPVDMLAVFDT
jgi:PTS system nitrogen regulatory IIA component